MSQLTLATLRRALGKPPSVLLRRVAQEAGAGIDRLSAGRRARRFDDQSLVRATGATSPADLWDRLIARPYPFVTQPQQASAYEHVCPGVVARVRGGAERAMAHEVDLLGSGPIPLGATIDWLTDHKSGHSWPPAFMRDIEYANLDRSSDVKFPWELSRLQWLIPAGQAFLFTADERYARRTRDVLDQWIAANPYAGTVNWSCTMEAALRIVTWTWFFHVFAKSAAWADEGFRSRFLSSLFLHGRFTASYLEHSDVNGNHCTADAAGLVFAGSFFGSAPEPAAWSRTGWALLDEEIQKQVTPDGVDYEGSVAYHRLGLELFLFPALYRQACALATPDPYRQRLAAMARFVASYSRPDGTTPLWGDADDGRMLPVGDQALTDHRYLVGLTALAVDESLIPLFSGPVGEVVWTFGEAAARRLAGVPRMEQGSRAFRAGGYFVMRNGIDHVFIDCAPVGLAGRGGHGHSDCLSFEAALNGTLLVSDCGSYVYTASVTERNRFRSTASHNTPRIAEQEMNRLVAPDNLWQLHADAVPDIRRWDTSEVRDTFIGSHSGYMRLSPPVRPVRTLELDHVRHALRIQDTFEGEGLHDVEIPLHLAPGVKVEGGDDDRVRLVAGGQCFDLSWTGPGWAVAVEPSRVSPRYGVAIATTRLVWRGRTSAGAMLTVRITSAAGAATPRG